MKKDIGFFDINGNYIPDIQELNEIERKEIMETKNFNEFFDELNEMANFKNFGESKEEEITIDGVNVAGCVRFQNDKMSCDLGGDCKGWDNCYYKQLKRLEQDYVNLSKSFEHLKTSYQENQEYVLQLKDENASLKNERTADLVKQIDELKAENEKLKALCDTYRTCYQAKHSDIKGLLFKYKQTLQDIKEIIEKGQWDFAGITEKQILQKISEVEE